MALRTIELLPQREQTRFNLRRWSEVLADPGLTAFEGRVETNRHGQIIMSPPPAPSHGSYQSEIAYLLRMLMPSGRVLTECPISTADGVRAADVAWASLERIDELGNATMFTTAPEICVEVLSPGESEAAVNEKAALYFDAGAKEVWLCSRAGGMRFLRAAHRPPLTQSQLCPKFPKKVKLT